MNQPPRSNQKKRRRQPQAKQPAVDLWYHVPEPAPPGPIQPSPEPSALIQSLGRPPVDYQAELVGQYFAAVVDRAATVANALASSAGLLADAPEE